MTWISLAVGIITGLTALLTYLLGDKRRKRKLKERQVKLEEKLRNALAKNDTLSIAVISGDLSRVRQALRNLNRK